MDIKKVSAMKTFNPRLKAVPASLELKIKQFSVDADGNIDVTLRPEATPIQCAQQPIKIETILIQTEYPAQNWMKVLHITVEGVRVSR